MNGKPFSLQIDLGTFWSKILSALVAFGLLFYFVPLAWGWWDANWQHRMKLTFGNAASSEDLTNFPVLVHLTSTHSDFWAHINSNITRNDTKDLRFVDADDSTELYFEAEKVNHASEDALIWVKVSQIDAGSTTDSIYVYYGNPAATQSAYHSANDVWDSNFKMVQHLQETSGVHYDSTSNDNDGTPQGGVTQNAPGKIDGADDFDGSNDLVNCGNDPSLRITTGAITVEMWIWRNDMVNALALDKDYASSYYFYFKSIGSFELGSSAAGDFEVESGSGELTIGKWYYVVGTFDEATDTAVLYKNGAEVKKVTDQTGSIGTNYVDLAIGAYYGGAYWFNGTIDEVRISDTARSAYWIAAEYLCMTDQFISYGTEEIGDTTPPDSSVDPLPTVTNTLSFAVTWSGSDDGGSGIRWYDVQVKDGSGGTWTDWMTQTTETSATYTGQDGHTYYFQCRAQDNAGNWEAYPGGNGDTHTTIDTTAPTGVISINNGAEFTNSRDVTLTLSATNASQMCFSNDNSSWSSWENYATSKSWTLTSGDGTKTVYVKFKDAAGNVSEIYSDDVILDTTPPKVVITFPSADTLVRGEVVIKGTASDENFRSYLVEYGQGTDPTSWTEITTSNSQVIDGTLATWDITVLNDGSYTLRLTAVDLADNWAEIQVSLRVDNTPPEATLIDYPTETVTGNTPKVAVTFTWTASDPYEITPVEKLVYQYKLQGHLDYQDWSDWTQETTNIYMLPSGNYTFKVRAKDEAGNYPEEDEPATAKSSFTVSLPIIIYPNPCYPNQGQIIRIANLPLAAEVKIYIYDLGGNLIRTLRESEAGIEGGSKTATWDLRNDNGEVVTRDIYIYFIPGASEKKTGKIAIIK